MSEFDYDSLMNILHAYPEVTVTFTKMNGEERVMNCTLYEMFEDIVSTNREKISVWDLDKEDWRSFRVDRVKDVIIHTSPRRKTELEIQVDHN